MAGDATNAKLWTGADVYVAPVGSTAPVDANTTALDAAFVALGLLDGEAGFAEGREEESSDFYAWGGLLVKRTKSKHKRTVKFVAMEDNDATFALINPGSTRGTTLGLTTSTVKVPEAAEIALVFSTTDGVTDRRRYIARAEVQEVGEVVESESGVTVYEVTVVIYPETDGTLYVDFEEAVA